MSTNTSFTIASVPGDAVSEGFASNRTRPMEFGGDQGNREVTDNLVAIIEQSELPASTDAAS